MLKKSVIVTGPQACGKTAQAEIIKKHFGLKRIVEDQGQDFPLLDCLILTNKEDLRGNKLRVVQFKHLVKLGVVKDFARAGA